MSYISLYRKYRPKTFNDVVGQETVVKILKNSIISNKISHAYIFSGPRGTGKTSIAKIFSKAVNCLNNITGDLCNECDSCLKPVNEEIDIIEIDAASNNGVDEIREIRSGVNLAPSNLKYKVYIIDEVHMLSTSAFNALLKTLEEPPSHVIFILATTEFNKIPQTVISRCQKFDFKKISDSNIISRLKYILDCENRSLNDEIIELIAKLSDGGLRDSINLLDQILSLNIDNITCEDVYNIIGQVSDDTVFELFDSIISSDVKNILVMSDHFYQKSFNFNVIIEKLSILIKNILIFNSTDDYFDENYSKKLAKYAKIDIDNLLNMSKILFDLSVDLKRTSNVKTILDVYLIKLSLFFKQSVEIQTNVSNIDVNPNNSVIKKVETNDNLNPVIEKKLLINNALSMANKDLKLSFVNQYSSLREYVSDKDYNSIANLLLKAIPEVVSDKNILFTFKNNFEVVLFDKNIDDIQKLLKLVYNKKYSLVAVSFEEWKTIKAQYIEDTKNGIKYEYVEEEKKVTKSKNNTELQNSVESIFGNNYVNM